MIFFFGIIIDSSSNNIRILYRTSDSLAPDVRFMADCIRSYFSSLTKIRVREQNSRWRES